MKKINFLSLITVMIFSMVFVACSGGGGGGSGGGASTAPDSGGGNGGGNGGGGGTAYSYKGWEVHTGNEATGFEIDSAKKHFQIANAFTMEIVDENILEVLPFKVGIYQPSCVDMTTWYFNLVLMKSQPSGSLNTTLASLEVSPVGMTFYNSDVQGTMSPHPNEYQVDRQNYTYTCTDGKYTIQNLGQAYINGNAMILKTDDGEYYMGLARSGQFTSSNVSSTTYDTYEYHKNGAVDACNTSGNYSANYGNYIDGSNPVVPGNYYLSYDSGNQVANGMFPAVGYRPYVPSRTGTYTDYYKYYASCDNTRSSSFMGGIGGTINGKKVGMFSGSETFNLVDAGTGWESRLGSSSFLIFVEK